MSTQGAYKRIDDGLVLHFDTANIKCFRGEPTVNLNPYPILTHWINSGTCTINQTETDILPPFINNQLSIWSCVVNTTGNIHFGMGLTTILPSTTYTISIWYRQNRAGVSSPYIRTNVNNNSIGSFTYNGSSNSNSWPINTWIRITATATTPSNENMIYLSNYVGSQVGDKIWYYGYQIEQKDHVTAYTSTSRGTTVATGGGLIDISNNGNNGELVNGVLYDSSNCGSLKFDGVDDYVIIPYNYNINNATAFTIECILYSNNISREQGIFSTSKFDLSSGWHIEIYQSKLIFQIFPSQYFTYSTKLLESNKYYHCSLTYSNGTVVYYVDGENSGIMSGYNITPSNSNIEISKVYGWLFYGKLPIIRFYNRALSQSEITQLYNQTKSRYL